MESAGAINLLPFVSAAPKMAVQIPKTCSTQYRSISPPCLALKGEDYMGGTKRLTASPFAPSFPGGIVRSAEFSVPGCRVRMGTAKTQPPDFKSHFRPGEPLTCNSLFHSNGSDHQKRNALSFFREKLKPFKGPEERRQYPPVQLTRFPPSLAKITSS